MNDAPPLSLFVVGAGRAGLGVANAARDAGARVVGVHGRRPASAGTLGDVSHGALPAAIAEASVILVAVRDRELDAAIEQVGGAALARGAVVLQASGSATPRAFDMLRQRAIPCGTFHPLVPLAEPARAATLLRGAWIGIDGDEAAEGAARALARLVGAHVVRIPDGAKPRYHAAAVFASNFPTVLAGIAESLMREAGIADTDARAAVRHLLSSAAANLAHGDAGAALTGPIARGDAVTVRAHLAALADDAIARDAYLALSRAAVALLGDGASGDVRDALGSV